MISKVRIIDSIVLYTQIAFAAAQQAHHNHCRAVGKTGRRQDMKPVGQVIDEQL